jgi:Zn-dependent peptidase ImmA (M78 family)
MTRVNISASVLRWALDRSRRTEAIKHKFPKLSEWLDGESQPTLRQLEGLAKATMTPLGYLFLQEPPVDRLPIPLLRTQGDDPIWQPSPDLLETVQTMERRQVWMREYLIEQGQNPLEFVNSAELIESPKRIARDIRRELGLVEGWAADQASWSAALRLLQKTIEKAGVIVVVTGIVGNNTHRKLDVSEFRGFVLVDEYAPLVFVNGADSKGAQMFTLVHEVAHIWLGSSAAFDLRELQPADNETEQICNRIAAEFLVPEEELQAFWPSISRDSNRFQAGARRFKVSEIVVARRLLDLELISKNEFLDFYRNYMDQEHRAAVKGGGGGDFYATQNLRVGQRFTEAVVRAAREEKLLYNEAFRLTGLYGKTFDRYVKLIESGEVV